MESNTPHVELHYLAGLPPEIFAEIIAQLLETVGMLKAIRLRVVNSKYFGGSNRSCAYHRIQNHSTLLLYMLFTAAICTTYMGLLTRN